MNQCLQDNKKGGKNKNAGRKRSRKEEEEYHDEIHHKTLTSNLRLCAFCLEGWHRKHSAFETRQCANLFLQGVALVPGNRDEHHQRKVGWSQATRDAFAHVSARFNDQARDVGNDTEAVGAGGVDDQVDGRRR